MSKITNILLATALILSPVFAFSNRLHAQGTDLTPGEITDNLDSVVEGNSALGNQPLETTLGFLINVLLGVLGIIFLVLVIWAGFLWMTAGGDEKSVEKAKNIMVRAVIGLVILLSAYAISNFVLDQLIEATGTET